jgi:hypothetical protein
LCLSIVRQIVVGCSSISRVKTAQEVLSVCLRASSMRKDARSTVSVRVE